MDTIDKKTVSLSIEKDPGWQQILLSRAEQKRNRITVDFFYKWKKECKEVQKNTTTTIETMALFHWKNLLLCVETVEDVSYFIYKMIIEFLLLKLQTPLNTSYFPFSPFLLS